MTCIAVKIDKRKIEIAGDTQSTWGQHKIPKKDYADKQIRAEGKVFQVNGMTIGCAGSGADIGLLRLYAKTTKPKEMERDFVLDWYIGFRDWAEKKARVPINDISIHGIIINEGKAFTFFDFMDCWEIKDFDAVGSGMFLAIGAMECGATVTEAVKVAIKYDLFCGGEPTKITIQL